METLDHTLAGFSRSEMPKPEHSIEEVFIFQPLGKAMLATGETRVSCQLILALENGYCCL